MALYYDKKHKPLSLKPGDKAFVALAGSMDTGYHLPNTISHKLSAQRVGPFEIIRAVGRLAYELKIPKNWKIHPIISVAHLEPYKTDPYDRAISTPVPETIADDAGGHEEWEVEDLLSERFNKRRKRKEWLVKWKDFGLEHNTWEPLENLGNAPTVVESFQRLQEGGNLVVSASTFFLPSPYPPPLANAFLASISLH